MLAAFYRRALIDGIHNKFLALFALAGFAHWPATASAIAGLEIFHLSTVLVTAHASNALRIDSRRQTVDTTSFRNFSVHSLTSHGSPLSLGLQ